MSSKLNVELVANGQYVEVLTSLESLTKACLDGDQRNLIHVENFLNLEKILEHSVNVGQDDILLEAFRFLRNSVAMCPRNQDLIREETKLIQVTKTFLVNSTQQEAEIVEVRTSAIRCSLQFLANFMVENAENSLLVLSSFPSCLGDLLLLFVNDEKVIQYASMVVHLGMKEKPESFLESPKIFEALLNNLQLEFVIYPMESLVKHKGFGETYNSLNPKYRIKVLTFLNTRSDLFTSLHLEAVCILKTNFIERADFILGSKLGDKDDMFSWEIAVLLEFLCAYSAEDVSLQSDPALITTVLCLLKQIHEAGKIDTGSENVFSPVEDLAKLTSTSTTDCDTNDIRAHPTFQFKAHLIRLVANLSHRNRSNQDKVRELECLPIILDNCKIDARNPFIAQWSILAIRNLCEGNEENQAYIREVQRLDTEKLLPKLELVEIS